MISHLNSKTIIVIISIGISLIACNNKKNSETPAPEETTPEVVCFNTNNNGTYTAGVGSVQMGTVVTSFTNGTMQVSRTACQEVSISLTSSGGNKTELVKNVTLNSNSIYDGNVSTGSITMSFGSHLQANAPGSFTFTGHK